MAEPATAEVTTSKKGQTPDVKVKQGFDLTDEGAEVAKLVVPSSKFVVEVSCEVLVATAPYENVKMRAGLHVPVDPKTVDEVYDKITSWLASKLTAFEEAQRGGD